ncbi:MAG: heparan-alpha-glucosaminide N-acetyltransferase domain-containing protein [Burkholderiaceae bacterium]
MKDRLLSLDAFRGFTVAAMLLVNNPGDWGHLYGPLEHAHWNGWTFTDWIFPFFVFISGISMTMSLGRRAAQGDDRRRLLAQTARRALTIIAIGLALNLIPSFNLGTLRIPGVLQRLGLCSLLTAPLVLFFGWRQQVVWLLALLLVYSLLMLGLPVPDAAGVWHTGSLQPGEDPGAWLDRWLMSGHLWVQSKTWDPEGLLSTLPAVASQLVGVLVGHWLAYGAPAPAGTRAAPRGGPAVLGSGPTNGLPQREPGEKAMWLMVAGLAGLWIGQLGDAWLMPINKSLWTPSYVALMGGWACLVFGVFYWLLDAMPLPLARARVARLARPLVVFGMNALFIFALSGLVAKLLGFIKLGGGISLKAALFAPIQALGLAPQNASLLFALGFVAAMYAIAWAMWRKKIFVKV